MSGAARALLVRLRPSFALLAPRTVPQPRDLPLASVAASPYLSASRASPYSALRTLTSAVMSGALSTAAGTSAAAVAPSAVPRAHSVARGSSAKGVIQIPTTAPRGLRGEPWRGLRRLTGGTVAPSAVLARKLAANAARIPRVSCSAAPSGSVATAPASQQGPPSLAAILALGNIRPHPITSQPLTLPFSPNILPSPPPSAAASPEVVARLGFEEERREHVAEYNAEATVYRHKRTGAQIMSLCCADENKVFGITFRTPPKDSTGIPHILEHSVLCGSRKYPVKEPFVELAKGSLNTFLNAFTYPDRTCYPVASTNLQDFYNLVDVYLDAVFFPNCVRDEKTFQQEGWHYELDDPKDDITFKGVVFNEMKGVYSQPDSVFMRAVQQALFPDNEYAVDSGGDPKVIPQLSFQQFQDFHAQFYHPSNARIWFYGDDDPNKRLAMIAEYLDKFDANPAAPMESQVSAQPLLSKPWRIVDTYPSSADAAPSESSEEEAADGDESSSPSSSSSSAAAPRRHMTAVNWVLSESPLSLPQELTLGFLDHLLLGTPAAPLRKKLLESGLGEAIVGGGLQDELRQPVFSIGLKGVAAADVPKVEQLVMEVLEELERDGFTEPAVEAAVNTVEFALRENNTGSFPRGLSLMLRSMGKWIYGGDPIEPLRFEGPLAEFKEKIRQPGGIKAVFSPLIRAYLLDNHHRVTVEMQPDPTKADADEEAERAVLESFRQKLAESDLEKLVEATKELKERQETPEPPEALRCVPSLQLEDIPKQPVQVPIAVDRDGSGATILRHDLFTNDVLYLDLALDMRHLPAHLVPLVSLFCQSLLEMGTKDMDFVDLNQLIGRKTGGISMFPLTSSKRGSKQPVSYLVARGKATSAQAADLLNLVRVVLCDVQLTDQQRFKQFVAQRKQGMESRFLGSGHSIAASRLDAMDSLAGWANEQMGGYSYLQYLRALEKRVDEDWPGVAASLEQIRQVVLSADGAVVNLTADAATLDKADVAVRELLASLPAQRAQVAGSPWSTLPVKNEAFLVPTQVNYVGKAVNLYDAAGYNLSGSAYVASKLVGMSWLWDRVRVSGGAYGGFCDFDSHSGVFTFLSYRDPNLLSTLDNYDGAVEFLRQLQLDEDARTKAIIGTIGDVDSYQLPDSKGYSSMVRYLLEVSEEDRQKRREEILTTTNKELNEFADYLQAVKEKGTVVVVASPGDVEAANKEKPGFLSTINVVVVASPGDVETVNKEKRVFSSTHLPVLCECHKTAAIAFPVHICSSSLPAIHMLPPPLHSPPVFHNSSSHAPPHSPPRSPQQPLSAPICSARGDPHHALQHENGAGCWKAGEWGGVMESERMGRGDGKRENGAG
ncbi:unnamed protein product [Closterium sp. Naga37s-1]|nr:unnamed protein product [Closterium sp. Naga37s-1]